MTGLNPMEMIVQKPRTLYGLQKSCVRMVQIDSAFIDKELDFQLDQFESFCTNFVFSYKTYDVSRCEVILTLFITFFRRNMSVFQNRGVDLTFFLTCFKDSNLYADFRHIIQLMDENLLDPLIYLLSILSNCDDKFIEFFAELDFSMCLLHAIAYSKLTDKRLFTNLVHLFMKFLPQHRICDEKFESFIDLYKSAFKKLDEMKMPTVLKSEILYIVVNTASPMPDHHPEFLGVLLEKQNLTADSLLFVSLCLSKMIEKDPEFAMILRDLDIIDQIFRCYSTWKCETAKYGVLAFLRSVLGVISYQDKSMKKHINMREIADAVISTDCSMTTLGMRLVLLIGEECMKGMLGEMGQYWQLLDAVVISLKQNFKEQVTTALKILCLMAKVTAVQLIRFLNDDFNAALVSLFRSGEADYQRAALGFFDVFLTTGDVGLSQISTWCMEFQDAGGEQVIKEMTKSQEPQLRDHAQAILDKIDSIQKAHRNRNRQ